MGKARVGKSNSLGVGRLREGSCFIKMNIKYLKTGSKSTKRGHNTILKSTPQRSVDQKYVEEMCQDDKFMH